MRHTSNTLRHRTLSETGDLEAFAAEYSRRSGHAADLGYLAQAQVRGFYIDGALVAGYAVAVKAHRYLAVLPAGACPLPADDCVEGTHIWIDRGVSTWARMYIYGRVLRDMLGTGRRYALGGSTVAKVVQIQRMVLPKMIYDGPVSIDGRQHRGRVYYGTRGTIMRGFAIGVARRVISRGLTRLTRRLMPGRVRSTTAARPTER